MARLDPERLARWSDGVWKPSLAETIQGLSNDTRTLKPGELFAAIATAKRDGHDFLETARERGASGAVVERLREDLQLPQLQVASVAEALQAMARGYRAEWRFPVVGVTGSVGKTTCKELIALLLGREQGLRTKGNLNNLIGVPMSILRPEARAAEYAVLEAGISEPGEMGRLADMIDPDYVVVTAIGPAHLKNLGSERGIAQEKGLLTRGRRLRRVFAGETCERFAGYLGGAKVAMVKEDAQLGEEWSFRFESLGNRTRLSQRIFGHIASFEYAGIGKGLASNVALGVAVASVLGTSRSILARRLAEWRPPPLRGEWRELPGGSRAYVDCYNANPLSMRDALEAFDASARSKTSRCFVIGCMEDLGQASSTYHEELGNVIPFRKEDFLLVIGSEATSVLRGMKNVGHDMSRCREVGLAEEARQQLQGFRGDVFLKGSRRYRLETILESAAAPQAGGTAAC